MTDQPAHAESCPVCGGAGAVGVQDADGAVEVRDCHGCDGRGWVTVCSPPPSRKAEWVRHMLN